MVIITAYGDTFALAILVVAASHMTEDRREEEGAEKRRAGWEWNRRVVVQECIPSPRRGEGPAP